MGNLTRNAKGSRHWHPDSHSPYQGHAYYSFQPEFKTAVFVSTLIAKDMTKYTFQKLKKG